ncbi:MAG: endonuclease V [Thermoanaerobaculia bacterium]
MDWPSTAAELIELQIELANSVPPPWQLSQDEISVGGCFVCFPRGEADSGPGERGDPGWAGAALIGMNGVISMAMVTGAAGAPYEAGLLALREGPLLEHALRSLSRLPEILLVNATGRDHPRSAGLALHLGAILEVPTVGVTHRPLVASGEWPEFVRGATEPLLLGGRLVGYLLCTRRGCRPLAVHAAWRTDPETAVKAVLATCTHARTPEPIRLARQAARTARSSAPQPSPRFE